MQEYVPSTLGKLAPLSAVCDLISSRLPGGGVFQGSVRHGMLRPGCVFFTPHTMCYWIQKVIRADEANIWGSIRPERAVLVQLSNPQTARQLMAASEQRYDAGGNPTKTIRPPVSQCERGAAVCDANVSVSARA
ncbi:hypothetical protein J6590_050663 [Homalodisca vitripennis]|nr:hypothetical protein J6590_050663 [Homalodisca vitripennis]